MSGRILAVDPGEKRIGVAISDLTGTIANPLCVIVHVARQVDAARVVELAEEHGAEKIVVGQPLGEDGVIGPQGRRSERFAEAIRSQTSIPVLLWDESLSTLQAQEARRMMGVSLRRRSGHLDDLAAAVILQSYLDACER
ncbi:MAG: Holliday junction resolvase RuvX [Anaerolineae bacterium]|nr:Holliday junction resolvase RuvX [Anaerolineae bacterium]